MNDAEWQGLFYEGAAARWSPLHSITWTKEGRASGRLTFTVEGADVTASTKRSPEAHEPELVGQATGGAGTRDFEARRVLLERMFRRSAGPGGPLLVRLMRLEPDAAWRVAVAAARGAAWEAAGKVEISEANGAVAFTLADGKGFSGSLQNDRLVGELAGSLPWSGTALPDALPFA